MFADLRRRRAWWAKQWLGGLLFGVGLFNLYDGLIQHKVLQLHQIRYDVNLLPYDLTWNILAGIIAIIGGVILYQTQRVIKNRGKPTYEPSS